MIEVAWRDFERAVIVIDTKGLGTWHLTEIGYVKASQSDAV